MAGAQQAEVMEQVIHALKSGARSRTSQQQRTTSEVQGAQ